MPSQLFKRSLLACAFVFSATVVAPVVKISAESMRGQDAREKSQVRQETAQANAEERKESSQTKLEDAKLKSCENREKAITNIMSRIADRGQKQLDLFTTIAERTQTFYAEKDKDLANYDELAEDVETKKAAAQEAVDALNSNGVIFDCSTENPKGAASAFKESLKSQIEALKAYKTSVKNLIVGVKSVQGTTSSSENGAE